MDEDLAALRRSYRAGTLAEEDVADDPFAQFRAWFEKATRGGVTEPNAMVLATADAAGRPSARHVLLKGVDDRGFVFYTNLGSRKAVEIGANPSVSLCFPWIALERQVVVCGLAEGVTRSEAEEYWASRPRESQIGAWASAQSTVIGSRAELEGRAVAVAERFNGVDLPLPEFWGGFVVRPETVEFWQGGPARLHDRLRYTLDADRWRLERLSP